MVFIEIGYLYRIAFVMVSDFVKCLHRNFSKKTFHVYFKFFCLICPYILLYKHSHCALRSTFKCGRCQTFLCLLHGRAVLFLVTGYFVLSSVCLRAMRLVLSGGEADALRCSKATTTQICSDQIDHICAYTIYYYILHNICIIFNSTKCETYIINTVRKALCLLLTNYPRIDYMYCIDYEAESNLHTETKIYSDVSIKKYRLCIILMERHFKSFFASILSTNILGTYFTISYHLFSNKNNLCIPKPILFRNISISKYLIYMIILERGFVLLCELYLNTILSVNKPCSYNFKNINRLLVVWLYYGYNVHKLMMASLYCECLTCNNDWKF